MFEWAGRVAAIVPPADILVPHLRLALDGHDLAALRISGEGKQESGKHGATCAWKLAGQNVSLALDLPLSYAKTMTKNGRVTQVPVGQHQAVQAEFQRICFIFIALHDTNHLVGTTTIPDRGVAQDGTCPAGASVAAAALTHMRCSAGEGRLGSSPVRIRQVRHPR